MGPRRGLVLDDVATFVAGQYALTKGANSIAMRRQFTVLTPHKWLVEARVGAGNFTAFR
jgi:hypothetical protein